MVVAAHIDVLVDSERQPLFGLRLYHVRRLVDAEPLRQVLHRVGVGSAAVIADVDREFVVEAVIPQGGFVGLPLPAQRVAVDVDGHGGRRCHVVAVQVGNVVDGDVDRALVDARVKLVEVHQQLVVAPDIAEVQVAQFLVGLHRSADVLVNVLTDEVVGIDEHGVALIGFLAVQVVVYLLAQHVGTQHDVAVLLPLLAVEVQIGDEALLRAADGLGAVALDERHRQCLLEEADAVEVSRHRVVLVQHVVVESLLMPYHVAKVEVFARHTAEVLGRELCLQHIVDVDAGHLVGAVDGHGVVVPGVVAVGVAELELHAV